MEYGRHDGDTDRLFSAGTRANSGTQPHGRIVAHRGPNDRGHRHRAALTHRDHCPHTPAQPQPSAVINGATCRLTGGGNQTGQPRRATGHSERLPAKPPDQGQSGRKRLDLPCPWQRLVQCNLSRRMLRDRGRRASRWLS